MASANRTAAYVKGFTDLGIQTTVLIPIPKENYSTSNTINKSKGVYNNGKFMYILKKNIRSNFFFKRRIDDVKGYFLTLIYIIAKIKSTDKIIVYRGGWIWYTLICLTAKFKRVKTFLELNELPYITAKNTLPKFKRFLVFNISFPLFDGFIAISETLCSVATLYKSKKSKILKVPIIVDPKDYSTTILFKEKKYIFHAGTLSDQKDGVIGMIKSFALAIKYLPTEIIFYLTGYLSQSTNSVEIKKVLDTYNINHRVVFLGYLSNDELQQYLHNASLAIINKVDSLQNKYCFPTKLGEYLDANIPVIITNVGEPVKYLENNVNACIVEPGNPQLIAEKIVELFENTNKRLEIAKNGKLLTYKEFNYLYQTKRIVNFIYMN